MKTLCYVTFAVALLAIPCRGESFSDILALYNKATGEQTAVGNAGASLMTMCKQEKKDVSTFDRENAEYLRVTHADLLAAERHDEALDDQIENLQGEINSLTKRINTDEGKIAADQAILSGDIKKINAALTNAKNQQTTDETTLANYVQSQCGAFTGIAELICILALSEHDATFRKDLSAVERDQAQVSKLTAELANPDSIPGYDAVADEIDVLTKDENRAKTRLAADNTEMGKLQTEEAKVDAEIKSLLKQYSQDTLKPLKHSQICVRLGV